MFEARYPLPAFYFRVHFDGNWGSDTSFQEVSGIGSEISTEEIVEGGENSFIHQLPKTVKHPKLVMKRGIAKNNSPLVKWCVKVLEEFEIPIMTKTVDVKLLGQRGNAVRQWSFNRVYPVKWNVENFESKKNEVAIESIEFAYTTCKRFF